MSIRTAIISIILALGIIASAGYFVFREREAPGQAGILTSEHETPLVEDADFRYEIVDTPEARAQGLSGRRDIPGGYGMLFVFDTKDRYGFWMKDMFVPIDILWLSDEGIVLDIEEAVSPDTYPAPFYPPVPVRYVLETRAGEARAQGWHVGTTLSLPD